MSRESPTRLLNERTGTIHKPDPDATDIEGDCGALRHVTEDQITTVNGQTSTNADVAQCGRCFDGVGGY